MESKVSFKSDKRIPKVLRPRSFQRQRRGKNPPTHLLHISKHKYRFFHTRDIVLIELQRRIDGKIKPNHNYHHRNASGETMSLSCRYLHYLYGMCNVMDDFTSDARHMKKKKTRNSVQTWSIENKNRLKCHKTVKFYYEIFAEKLFMSSFQLEMSLRPSYRQTRSLDNIGENSTSMDPWYRNNHLIFINENSVLTTNDGSSSNNEIIER